jgi:hypothetical protein
MWMFFCHLINNLHTNRFAAFISSAWTKKMAYKNESEICTSWEEYAQMGVLDQQSMPRLPSGQ